MSERAAMASVQLEAMAAFLSPPAPMLPLSKLLGFDGEHQVDLPRHHRPSPPADPDQQQHHAIDPANQVRWLLSDQQRCRHHPQGR